MLVAHEAVTDLAIFHSGDVVSADLLQEGKGIVAGEAEAGHVADVEEASVASNREMFFHNARVDDWHHPACKLDHAGTEVKVLLIQRGFGDVCHVHLSEC